MLHKIKSFFECRQPDQDSSPEHALRLATAALLMEISRADQHISSEERRTMAELVSRVYELEEDDARELMLEAEITANDSVSLHEFTRVLNEQLSREERIRIVEMLWEVANADGHIDEYEDYYVRKIADLIHVSHSDFIRMKHRVLGTD